MAGSLGPVSNGDRAEIACSDNLAMVMPVDPRLWSNGDPGHLRACFWRPSLSRRPEVVTWRPVTLRTPRVDTCLNRAGQRFANGYCLTCEFAHFADART